MIRINLLPVKAAKKREAGQRQLLVVVAALMGLVLALFILHSVEADSLTGIQREAAGLQTEIDGLKAEVGDIDQRRAQYNELLAQDRVIAQLRAGQTGPLWVMRELSRLLSSGGQPTLEARAYEEIVRRDPNAAYNPTWDPRRLVMTGYSEIGGTVKIDALATDNADVAELLKRMAVSKFFQDVRLIRSDTVSATAGAFKHVKFAVTCRVVYQ